TFFEEDLEQQRGKYKNVWSCEAGADKICVSPDGSLYPCSRFICTDEKGTSYYKLGDVQQGITEHRLRDDLLDQREMIRPKCMRCEYKDFCPGGCP
ncbi:MAG: SPASM domain-containing protein, partial [bacterium]